MAYVSRPHHQAVLTPVFFCQRSSYPCIQHSCSERRKSNTLGPSEPERPRQVSHFHAWGLATLPIPVGNPAWRPESFFLSPWPSETAVARVLLWLALGVTTPSQAPTTKTRSEWRPNFSGWPSTSGGFSHSDPTLIRAHKASSLPCSNQFTPCETAVFCGQRKQGKLVMNLADKGTHQEVLGSASEHQCLSQSDRGNNTSAMVLGAGKMPEPEGWGPGR